MLSVKECKFLDISGQDSLILRPELARVLVSGTCLRVSGTSFFCNASHIFVVRQFFRSAPLFRNAPAHYTKKLPTFWFYVP